MAESGERIRNVEVRESASMLEFSPSSPTDPNTLSISGAIGTFLVDSTHGSLYYNSDGTTTGWIPLGGSGAEVIVDKIVWLSAYDRTDLTSPNDQWITAATLGIPTTSKAVICRFVYLSKATSAGAFAAIGSGKQSTTHQAVLHTDASSAVGERDAHTIIETDGSGRIYLDVLGTWTLRIEVYGYVIPVTVHGP